MAKKKNGLLKFAVGVGAAAVAGKVAYDKVKAAKNKLNKEEQDSAELEVRKYNAVCEKRMVEVEDEEFMGCEVKAVASKLTVDLSLAVFEKDVYINFESISSNVSIVLPEGVNVTCDIDKKLSNVRNYVENSDEDGIHTVYIIGKATLSSVEVVPINFDADSEEAEDTQEDFDDEAAFADSGNVEVKVINESKESEEPKKADETAETEKQEKSDDEEDVLAGIEIEEVEDVKEDSIEADKDKKTEAKENETETINLEEV